jgi:hypothetical protein
MNSIHILQQGQPGALHDIGGIVAIQPMRSGNSPDGRRVPGHEFAPGRPIAEFRGPEQFGRARSCLDFHSFLPAGELVHG